MADQTSADERLQQAVVASNEGRHEEAREAFTQALALDPDQPEAMLGLGLSCMALRDFPAAVAALRQAAATPQAPAIWHGCLAQALYMSGEFAAAAGAFEVAAALETPGTNARLTHARARALATLIDGSVETAMAQYLDLAGDEAEDLDAIAREAFAVLGVFGHEQAAAGVGAWRLARNPEDHVQAYLQKAVSGEAVDRAPASYVQAHFDRYADSFDQQLVESLNYSAPEQMAQMVAAHADSFVEILDLGCGTGLAAPALARFGGRLIGVDLSQGMLDKAQTRGGYDRLVQADATAFLDENPDAFDLVFAADVVIYLGDLTELFRTAHRALRPGGLLALSTEIAAEGWIFRSSGRFAHSHSYVTQVAQPGFALLEHQTIALRQEGRAVIEGSLHLFRRAA